MVSALATLVIESARRNLASSLFPTSIMISIVQQAAPLVEEKTDVRRTLRKAIFVPYFKRKRPETFEKT